jgi:hypothetical protein
MIDNTGEYINKNYNVGTSFLKSHFKSYWKSSYKGNISPIEAWYDDTILTKILINRFGLGNSDTVYNISLNTIIYSLNVNRYCVSFFRPVLASTIYENYLGKIDTPNVLDPCAGFGGRLIGFKLKYPNGKYVGVEPSKETYDGLCSIVDMFGFTNVELYNCKIE